MRGYFKQAFEAFKSGDKPYSYLIVLMLIGLIPIFGTIIVLGVAFSWGRESAWGVDSSLPKLKGNFKNICKTGGIAFVIIVGWGLVASFVFSIISQIPFIGYLCALFAIPLCLAVNLFIEVIALRAAIYDSLDPAFQFRQPFEMVKRDTGGLLQVFLIALIGGFICLAIIAVAFGVVAFAAATIGFSSGLFTDASPNGFAFAALAFTVVPLGILFIIIAYVLVSTISTFLTCIFARAMGIWMAQFAPVTWGRSKDPLP